MEHTEAIWQQRLAKRRAGITWKTILEAEGWTWGGTCSRQLKQARERGWIPPEESLPPAIRSDGRRVGMAEKRGHTASTPEAHLSTPVHPGTLEEYQEVIEEVHQSVPDVPHISTDEVPLSTPVVHPEVSPEDSSTVHPSVPARQEPLASTPMVHPGTLLEEDWELWATIKARWPEVEKILAERQVALSTPLGTPGHTQKKTYVFDVQHIRLIDRYAQDHRLDLKDVIYAAFQEFFERRGDVTTE